MTRERVDRLRGLMEKHGIDAYLIPSTDAHQSEYVPDAWQRRPWISGFTGSAGDVIVARSTAGLWTDSRYYLQAEKELAGTGIKLFKKGLIDVPDMLVWVADTLKPGQVFGADPALVSYEMANRINGTLAPRGIQILWLEGNLIDALWEKRPGLPFRPISVQRLEYAGESAEEKLGRLRERMKTERAGIHILTTLDAIAWLFNIRGGDVAYNPVAVAFAVVTDRDAHLFIGQGEGDESLSRHLEGIAEIHPYENCKGMISACARTGEKIWLDPLTASQWIVDVIGDTGQITFKESPVTLFKAVKNQVEIEGFIRAHRRDGLAMVRFLNWLAQSVPAGGVTEISASKKLASLRAELPLYQGPSFRTISAYGDHGAIVHYSSTPATDCE
ncbi:MAG TPA: aminopeptidase P family N-terminal domain-containing protein, partial [Spirochaetia bacterium]|nr:aminopeptidase P family N-terminal domain-containing protein [Spirochaetia bacterium]